MKTVQLKEAFKGFPKVSSITSILGLNSVGETSVITLEEMRKEIGIIKITKILFPGEIYEIKGSLKKGGLVLAQNMSIEHEISLFMSVADQGNHVIIPSNGIGTGKSSSANIILYRTEVLGPLFMENKSSKNITVGVCFIPIS